MDITTWSAVRAEIARAHVLKHVIAARMDYTPTQFALLINTPDTTSMPTAEWVERFRAALMAEEVAK